MFKKFLSIFTFMAIVSSVVLGSYTEVSAKTILLRKNHSYLNLGLCKADPFEIKYKVNDSGEFKEKTVSIDCPAGERFGIKLDSVGKAEVILRVSNSGNGISESRACPIGKIGTYGRNSVTKKLQKYEVDITSLTAATCYYGGQSNNNKAKIVKVIKTDTGCKAICVNK